MQVKCSGNLQSLDTLCEKDKTLIQWRTNIWEDEENSLNICYNHKIILLNFYEKKCISCIDPFQRHTELKSKSLRIVTDNVAASFKKYYSSKHLPPGSKICEGCRLEVMKQISDAETREQVKFLLKFIILN